MPHRLLVLMVLPGDSYVVTFWLIYFDLNMKKVVAKTELHWSVQVAWTSKVNVGPCRSLFWDEGHYVGTLEVQVGYRKVFGTHAPHDGKRLTF